MLREAYRLLLYFSGAGCLILWLIAASLLMMYHFPLEIRPAAKLVIGFGVQYIVLLLGGGSMCFAAVASLYVILTALYGCLLLLLGAMLRAARARHDQPRVKMGCLAGGLALLIPPPIIFLFPIFLAGFHGQSWLLLIGNGAVVGINIYLTIRTLMDFSIWGRPDPREEEYYKEWERWAAPTILLLIGTVVGAAMLVGIRSAGG